MTNTYLDLTNEELVSKLKISIEETNLIAKEISRREKIGSLKRRFDEVDQYIFKKYSSKDKRSA